MTSGDDHDPVHIPLDRYHLECKRPGNAVTIAVESNGLVFVHGDCGTDHAGIKSTTRKWCRRGVFFSEAVADDEWAIHRPNGACQFGLAAVLKMPVQLVDVACTRDGSREPALYSPHGILSIRLFVAPSRHAEERTENVVAGQGQISRMNLSFAPEKNCGSDGLGIVPPNLLGNTVK